MPVIPIEILKRIAIFLGTSTAGALAAIESADSPDALATLFQDAGIALSNLKYEIYKFFYNLHPKGKEIDLTQDPDYTAHSDNTRVNPPFVDLERIKAAERAVDLKKRKKINLPFVDSERIKAVNPEIAKRAVDFKKRKKINLPFVDSERIKAVNPEIAERAVDLKKRKKINKTKNTANKTQDDILTMELPQEPVSISEEDEVVSGPFIEKPEEEPKEEPRKDDEQETKKKGVKQRIGRILERKGQRMQGQNTPPKKPSYSKRAAKIGLLYEPAVALGLDGINYVINENKENLERQPRFKPGFFFKNLSIPGLIYNYGLTTPYTTPKDSVPNSNIITPQDSVPNVPEENEDWDWDWDVDTSYYK